MLALACLWVACGGLGYTGRAQTLSSTAFDEEPGWLAVRGVPVYHQAASHLCGPTALAMVLRYWDPRHPTDRLLDASANRRVSSRALRDVARAAGLEAFVVQGTVQDLVHELSHGRPVIVGLAKPTVEGRVAHYEVVIGLHRRSQRVATLDPAAGWRQNSFVGFLDEWLATGSVLIALWPAPERAAPVASRRCGHECCEPSVLQEDSHAQVQQDPCTLPSQAR